ncbi:hypothetical protein BGZ72_009747 [Mortierella alpina]|nr:hypothetical protein BGZ72_009747 [Mortierella alpina]
MTADALVSLSSVDDKAVGQLPHGQRLQVIKDRVEQAGSSWNNQVDSGCPTDEKHLDSGSSDQDPPEFNQGHPSELRVGKSSRRVLRLISVMALALVILFSVAVLNLLSGLSTSSSTSASMNSFSKFLRNTFQENEATENGKCFLHSNIPKTVSNGHRFQSPPHSFSSSASSPPLKPRGHPQLPPQAKRIPRPLTLYNETLIDNYRWMHDIDRDPDVQKYIEKESEYMTAWVQQSGVETIQKQLENEMQQIRSAMYRQARPSNPHSEHDISTNRPRSKPTVERLEDTQFWDVDRWRYWLDTSVGDFGVYKRRPILRDHYPYTLEEGRRSYTSSITTGPTVGDNPSMQNLLQSVFSPPAPSTADTVYSGGCSSENSPTPVQIVLDINRLAMKHRRKDAAGEFSFGSIEVQPKSTSVKLDVDSLHVDKARRLTEYSTTNEGSGHGDPTGEDLFLAYSYDVSGNERYRIHILPLTSLASSIPEDQDPLPSQPDSNTSEDSTAMIEDGLININGVAIKDAGTDMRWVKLSGSLYLYFTRLDPKGLAREVWRIKVNGLEDEGSQSRAGKNGAPRQKYEPEMVMQEKDERNVLGWNLVRQAEEDVIYNVEHHSGYFYIRTNHGGAVNFKVIRIPVEYSSQDQHVLAPRTASHGSCTSSFLKEDTSEDDVVIAYNSEEYIERIEVFVEHIVAWVWRAGLQEARIFAAPRPGDVGIELPLKELQRLRPYDKEFKIATVMPGNIRHEEQRLMRDFYSTKLLYSNCSFVHPWALYEFDMHSLTPLSLRASDDNDDDDDDDDDERRLRNATRLVCRDPFPVGIRYGHTKEQHSTTHDLYQDFELSLDDTRLEDSAEEEEAEMAKIKEMRIMIPSTHGSTKNLSLANYSVDDDASTVMIPVSLVYYSLPDNPQFPRKAAFVVAYGAYGTLTAPKFDPLVILPLLHRGFIYVLVHPRGDGVMGREWYADGKQEHKINTFYDVEDVLLHLRDSGMVEKEAVVIEGRSAGGLVSGWMANRWGEIEAPPPGSTIDENGKTKKKNIVGEMVKAVLAQVPFVDVIAGMSDPSIPWVEYEWAEWGSPLESREVFEVMKRYSPYDRIRNQPYPAMMIMGGLSDGRVSYAEPLKFVAKLRGIDGKTNDCEPSDKDTKEEQNDGALTKDKKMCAGRRETPLLLKMEEGGHFSGNSSLWMAFAIHQLGAEKVVTGASSDGL